LAPTVSPLDLKPILVADPPVLFFDSWMPTTAVATFGVAVGVFLLAMFERYIKALRRASSASWEQGYVCFLQLGRPAPLTRRRIVGFVRPRAQGPFQFKLKNPSSSDNDKQAPPTASADASASDEKSQPLDSSAFEASPAYLAHSVSADDGSDPTSYLPPAARAGLARDATWSRPFRLGVDVPRGLVQALETMLHYLLM
jgi:copper transporter 1